MSSKYIPKSRLSRITPAFEWSTDSVDFRTIVEDYKNEDIWYSLAKPENVKEKAEARLEKQRQNAEKERIEAIPLEQLEFTDLYEFPFHISKYGGWVYDAKDNFIFQFEFNNEETREKIIQILNGELLEYKKNKIESKGGQIFINDQLAITIRGWGGLTGTGAYNLDGEWAGKIQDNLQKFIVEKLAQEK